jgi:hypothetical protein
MHAQYAGRLPFRGHRPPRLQFRAPARRPQQRNARDAANRRARILRIPGRRPFIRTHDNPLLS